MMAIAFVLINAEIGVEGEVLEELGAIQEVKETYMIYGVSDIIARVEAVDMKALKDVVSRKIRSLEKVRSTLTLICM